GTSFRSTYFLALSFALESLCRYVYVYRSICLFK
ncbi:hypothetical protein CSUI_004449, partial [Cystoisospora suis]